MGSLILSFRNITPLIAPQDYFTQYYASRWKVSPKTLGNFNNDGDGDGDGSENVTFKMNSRFLKLSLIDYNFAEKVESNQISLELIFWGPHSSLERERKIFTL